MTQSLMPASGYACLHLQGVFLGALLSMSSTSVVVKCLEAYRMTASAYGQITIGTLILQVSTR